MPLLLRQQAAEIQQLKTMIEKLLETLEWTQDRMGELAAHRAYARAIEAAHRIGGDA